jgi:organic radical activating enzyme
VKNLLKGSFDLHIIDKCNLHCKACVVLDYLESGLVTNDRYSLDDVKEVIFNLQRLDLRLEELKILGGEPTIHNQLDEIIDYLKDTDLFDTLTLVTNGLNFTDDVIKSLLKLDKLIISIYPLEENLEEILKKSSLYNYLLSKIDVDFWHQNSFQRYGVKQSNLEYSTELNWKRCYQKDDCRVLTKKYLYRCTITYSEKKDMCTWEDRQEVMDFIESDNPLDHCKDCPYPPLEMRWTSNNLPIDEKNLYRGINLINEYTTI